MVADVYDEQGVRLRFQIMHGRINQFQFCSHSHVSGVEDVMQSNLRLRVEYDFLDGVPEDLMECRRDSVPIDLLEVQIPQGRNRGRDGIQATAAFQDVYLYLVVGMLESADEHGIYALS